MVDEEHKRNPLTLPTQNVRTMNTMQTEQDDISVHNSKTVVSSQKGGF